MAQQFGSSTLANEPPSEEDQFKVQQERTLFRAVIAQDVAEVQNVLSAQRSVIDVNVQMSGASTALHHAAAGGDIEIMKALVGAGADVNIQNELLMTPLMCACLNAHEGAIRYLVDQEADQGVRNKRGQSAQEILHTVEPALDGIVGSSGGKAIIGEPAKRISRRTQKYMEQHGQSVDHCKLAWYRSGGT